MLSELMECSTQCALARRARGGFFLRQIKRQQIEPKELIIMRPLRGYGATVNVVFGWRPRGHDTGTGTKPG